MPCLQYRASLVALGAAVLIAAAARPQLEFSDVAASAGVRATLHNGDPARHWIPEANGGGVAWLDYDNDGLMDLLIVNGSDMDRLRQSLTGETPADRADGVYLFHNVGNGHFEDSTAKAGLANPYWGTGANAADYDNDGFVDILITTIGRDLLYHNNGNGTFTEVSKRAGLRQSVAWHTGSAFGDFDGDGKLDLFITGYIDVHSTSFNDPAPVCDYQGQHVFCGPIGLKGEHSVVYRNNGNGTFTDVTAASGLAKVPPAHGFTALTGDFNSDGKLDILVANDSDPNYLFLNNGDGTFRESALERGVAYNADGRTQSNMGVTAGELGASGRLDVLTTTFDKDYFPLFRENKTGGFEEVSSATGIATATMKYLGWACGLADFDNSGVRDLWTANGHVYPTDRDYNEPVTIFRSDGHKAALVYSFPQEPNNSYRGGATADFDNNGKTDLAIVPIAGSPLLLKNNTVSANHWIGFKLQGTRSNRDAIGAKLQIDACGRTQSDELRSGGSYLSHNDPRMHFGLGDCAIVDKISIRWPAGEITSLSHLSPDHYQTVQEPK